MGFLEGIQSVATLLFALGSSAVGLRLGLLFLRTRQLPELLLGGSIFLTGGLGYGILIAALAIRGNLGPMAPEDVPALSVLLGVVGRVVHDIGVTLYLGFVVHVFRRQSTWAYVLAAVMGVLLWAGFATSFIGEVQSDLARVGSPGWFCEYAVIWSYPIWTAIESLRYFRLMRRRAALGLSDPLVMNRFLLWGVGSILAALAVWTASIPFAFVADLERLDAITPTVRVVTALLGLASVSMSLLAFLPPAWYRRRFTDYQPGSAQAVAH